MTTASELFYTTRRSRLSRNTLDLGLDSSPVDRIFHHHIIGNRRHHHHHHHSNLINNNNNSNNTRRDHRHDQDGCDPLRRSPLVRHQPLRPSASERDTVRLEEGNSQSFSGNIINLDNLGGIPNSHRSSENDRLPGAVLLARERLLERLRGVSLSRNRQNNRASPAGNRNDLILGDDFRLFDAGDGEADGSSEWLAGSPLITDSTRQVEQLLVPPQQSKRPPGLTQVELNCLRLEVFSQSKCSVKGEILRSSQECSICLESFVEGDKLMCLPCAHRFHSSCLDPWVRVCGDCPYCRRGIVCK